MKNLIRLLCVLLLAGAVAMIFANQKTAARLRVEHDQLLSVNQEAAKLQAENEQLEKLRAENAEFQRLRAENKDLPKLRNDVRQLRRTVDVLNKLRVENERLTIQQAARSTTPIAPRAVPENFIYRTALMDAGLATPEAAAQTFFWAMCRGDLQRLGQCTVNGPEVGGTGNPDVERERLVQESAKFPGFAITGKTQTAPDEVTLNVQTSAGGSVVPMKLKFVGGEWKVNTL